MRHSAKVHPLDQMPFDPVADYNKKAVAFLMRNYIVKTTPKADNKRIKIVWTEIRPKLSKIWCCVIMKEPKSKNLARVQDQSKIVDSKGNDIDLPTLALGSTAIEQPIRGSLKELRFNKMKGHLTIQRHALPKDKQPHNPTLTHKYLDRAVHRGF